MVMACLGLGYGEGQGKESQHMQRGVGDAARKGKRTKMGGTSLGSKWEGSEVRMPTAQGCLRPEHSHRPGPCTTGDLLI